MNICRIMALLMALSVAGLVSADEHMAVEGAWVREAPPAAMAMAGYMTLHNHADRERVLIGAESPAFEMVMLHRTVMEGDISKMSHLHMITIPAHGTLIFEPNSYHLMMMRPKQPLKAGDKLTVTLRFRNGDSQDVSYEVRAAMDAMGQGAHHDMAHGQSH